MGLVCETMSRHARPARRSGVLLVLCEKPTYAEQVSKKERPVWMDTEPLPGSALGGNL